MKYGTNGIIPELVNMGADGCSGMSPLAGTSVCCLATQNSGQTCRSSCAFTLLAPFPEHEPARVRAARLVVGPPYRSAASPNDAVVTLCHPTPTGPDGPVGDRALPRRERRVDVERTA